MNCPVHGATVYWGGGTEDISDNTAVPAGPAGTWDATTKNWANSPTAPNTYAAWQSGDFADLGASAARVITLGSDLNVGGFSSHNNGSNNLEFKALAAQVLTLTGSQPLIHVERTGGTEANRRTMFGDNVTLAGSNGFIKTGNGTLEFNIGVTHSISGTIRVEEGFVIIAEGRVREVSSWEVIGSSATLRLNHTSTVGNQNRISDTATISLRGGGTFQSLLGSSGNNRSETVGMINFQNDLGRLALSNTSNSAVNLIFANGLERGTRGTLFLSNLGGHAGTVNFTSNAPVEDTTLPWAIDRPASNTVRFVQYTGGTLVQVASSVAPQDVSTWHTTFTSSTDAHYDWTGVGTTFTGSLAADTEVRTLGVGTSANTNPANVLNLGGNNLIAQAVALGGFGTTSTFTVENGFISAPTALNQLYVHASGNQTLFFNAALGRKNGLIADRTFDVILSLGTTTRMETSNDNNYIGTMYVQGGAGLVFDGPGRKVTGDLHIGVSSTVTLGGIGLTGQFSPSTVITMADQSRFSITGSGANTEVFRGLQGSGTFELGSASGQNKQITINTAGDDFTFSGTITGTTQNTAALIKAGSGSWILSGDNTYDAATRITGGTLMVTGSHVNSITGRGYTIETGGTLAGDGSITLTDAAIHLQDGGFIEPGNLGAGVLSATSVLWDAGGQMNFQLGATPLGSDYLELSAAFSQGSGLGPWHFAFSDADSLPLLGAEYKLIGFESTTFTDADIFSYSYSGGVAGFTGEFSIISTGSEAGLYFSTVPEPGRVIFLGLGLCGLLLHRRRA